MSGAEEAGAAEGAPAQDLYREKPVSKLVRVMTVMAYLTSVSFAAILLSVYYICIWKSPEAPRGDDPGYLLARQGTHRDYEPAYFSADGPRNSTGRGDSAVSETPGGNSTEAALGALNYTDFTDATDAAPPADATAPDTLAPDAPTPDVTTTDATGLDASTADELATPVTRAERPVNLTVT